MPQTLTVDWEKELWENYNKIQEKYLHTLWNITLTWYNSKYSNKTFWEKRNIEKWFKDSPLYLNWFLKDVDVWNEENILKRYEILKEKALKIWELPKTEYKEKKDETKLFTLSSEKNFTGEDILEYIFEWKEYKTNNWTSFFINIVKIIYEKDSLLMKNFINDDYLSTKFYKEAWIKWPWDYEKIDENLYLKFASNTESKLYALREILKKYNINLDDVLIYIK
jgi:hypothetical protein